MHGITLDQLEDKPKFAEIAAKFSDFIRDDYIVAHNANFDVGFLNFELTDNATDVLPLGPDYL